MYKNNNFILAIWLSNYVHSERSFLGIQKPIHSIPKPEALCQSTSLLFILSIIWPLQASGLSKKIPIRSATTIKGHLHKEDITEGTTPQFPTWIFNFWPYGQLWAVHSDAF